MYKKNLFFIFLVSLGISFILYGNTINGAFVYDDNFFSARSELRSVDHLTKLWLEPYTNFEEDSSYRPLAIFSFSLNFLVFGNSPVSFHIINIILNALAVFLLFLLVLKFFNNRNLAFFSALLYAFLPIHTEAVAFIKSRDEILATVFVLLAWLLFIKYTEDKIINWKGIIISSLLFFLAILSKETFVLSPLLFFAIFIINKKVKIKDLLQMVLIFLPVILLYFLMRIKTLGLYALGNSRNDFVTNPLFYANLQQHLWTPFKIASMYIGKIFIPINLSATYFYNQVTLVTNPLHSIQVILGLVFLCTLVLLVSVKKTRITLCGIGAIIFLISYFMVSKFLFQAGDIVAERWMYFPSAGLSMIGGYVIFRIYNYKRELGLIILTVILITYGFIVVTRNKVWLTSDALFGSMITDAPNSVQGYLMLNVLNFHVKTRENKVSELTGWIDSAYKIAPNYPPVLNWKGIQALNNENFESAEKYFLDAVKGDNRPNYLQNLAKFYIIYSSFYNKNRQYNASIKQLIKLRALVPDSWEPYFLLGQAYSFKKDYPKATYYFKKAVSLEPNDADLKKSLESLEKSIDLLRLAPP